LESVSLLSIEGPLEKGLVESNRLACAEGRGVAPNCFGGRAGLESQGYDPGALGIAETAPAAPAEAAAAAVEFDVADVDVVSELFVCKLWQSWAELDGVDVHLPH
jgi:hypothetical protein